MKLLYQVIGPNVKLFDISYRLIYNMTYRFNIMILSVGTIGISSGAASHVLPALSLLLGSLVLLSFAITRILRLIIKSR